MQLIGAEGDGHLYGLEAAGMERRADSERGKGGGQEVPIMAGSSE